MLEIDDLHVQYGAVEVIKGISLTVEAGRDCQLHRSQRHGQVHGA